MLVTDKDVIKWNDRWHNSLFALCEYAALLLSLTSAVKMLHLNECLNF